jgi:hypothetical protein
MGLTDESGETWGHDSPWFKYCFVNWFSCERGTRWVTYCKFKPYTTFLKLICSCEFQGKKLQDLLSLLPIDSLDLNRQHVRLKANFALMQLYVERGKVETQLPLW